MANLLISNQCNLKCPYCFASLEQRANGHRFVELGVFSQMLDYLDRSGIQQVRLLGGEPTLHPHFETLLKMALERQKTIFLFTNGIFSNRITALLREIPPQQCIVLVNANSFSDALQPEDARRRRRKMLEQLGERCRLGFTIYAQSFDLRPLFQLSRETGCSKSIRLGLAQPAGESNSFLHPNHYPIVGSQIATFATVAAKDDIRLEFDCGFVRCMFSEEDLQTLRAAGSLATWICSPIIDIDLNGSAYSCFPLYGFEPIQNATRRTAAELRAEFEHKLSPLRRAGIYPECSSCVLREQEGCTGGCMAAALRRLHRPDWKAEIPEPIIAMMDSC